jgi:hypothetical protein
VRLPLRRALLLLAGLVSALALPAAAAAEAPVNDTRAGAIAIQPAYIDNQPFREDIPPTAATGGWTDATTEIEDTPPPSCLGPSGGFHSMWYSLHVPEASVLTVLLKSSAVDRYQPVVTIINGTSLGELACGLGGNDTRTDPGALASSYVPQGNYYIRIAAVSNPSTSSNIEQPTVTLSESLRDVTPPQIRVSVSGKAKIVGVGKTYTFDASASTDQAAGVDDTSAIWEFYDEGRSTEFSSKQSSTPEIAKHAWKTPGLHRVTLTLSDKSKNKNIYVFNVLVHNFVPPRVGLRVFPPTPGSRTLHVVLTHDVPIRLRLVIMQGDTVLRAIPSKLLKGSRVRTSLQIALRKKVGKIGFVVVSGVASDVGQFPNTVPLLTCSLDPVNGGGKCA